MFKSLCLSAIEIVKLPEKEVIWTTITLLSLQNLNNVKTMSMTEQFIYTMIAFLGKENAFLDPDIKTLLANFVQTTFKSQALLNFNSKFGGKLKCSISCIENLLRRYSLSNL